MSLSPLVNLLAIGSSFVPTVRSAAISLQSPLSPSNDSIQLPGFPHPNPIKSYWQDPPSRIANLRTTPDLPCDETFDYVIVGSGISGAATAFKLLQRDPELSILMLEARTAASGASGRNGGHCKTGDYKQVKSWVEKYGEDEALKIGKLEQDCVDDMADFVRSYNVSSGWQDVETADLYWTKAKFDEAVEVLEFQRELEARRPNDVPQNNPRTAYAGQAARDYWKWPEILGAITYSGHTQNPYLTVSAMLELGLEMGLNLQTNTMALNLVHIPTSAGEKTKWEVQTDRGTVKGNKVVLATNGYTSALHPGFKSTNFLEPGRSQVSAVHPEADTSENPVFRRSNSHADAPGGGDYIIARAPGDIGAGDVIYGGGQQFSPTRERNITDDSVINETIAKYLHDIGRVTFGYKNWGETTKYVHDWVGITCYTPDGFPVVGAVPGEDGLWASVCMNGHGMAWAFRSAEALVEMMVEGKEPEWFPQPFRANRAWKASQ
jgi:glycine/D-amino acid oxidase-like deaminating enzyme